jgi:hypothetical protein
MSLLISSVFIFLEVNASSSLPPASELFSSAASAITPPAASVALSTTDIFLRYQASS